MKERIFQRLQQNMEEIQLFGSTNSSQIFALSELDFEIAKSDMHKTVEDVIVKLPVGTNIGDLYSMRLSCHHWNSNLTKVKIVYVD